MHGEISIILMVIRIGEASLNKYGNISRCGRTLYHHCAVEYDANNLFYFKLIEFVDREK